MFGSGKFERKCMGKKENEGKSRRKMKIESIVDKLFLFDLETLFI